MNISNYKVLLVYESYYGYIAQISQEIKKIVEEEGVQTQLINLKKVRQITWPSLTDYHGLLLGSYELVPKRKTRKFLIKNENEVKSGNKILGAFVSDPFMLSSIYSPTPIVEMAPINIGTIFSTKFQLIMHKLLIIGSVIDFTRSSKLEKYQKDNIRKVLKKITKKHGIEFDLKGLNDFRDWDQIRDFAISFAELVKEKGI